ncbi:recombinase family protein [Clostridium sporogenes]|uniref:recombinase family protein n=1 Tax=Clostridium sporogenes TaxID=1509 RepID=UPI00062BF8F7|nr:recombinase family protein [Clostridium sporogenes]NFQ02762.1 recombinase family protein [Clostridium sporogenes]NFQ41608.1 recombinase family protein [Clostridium sporogenes]NFR24929.1 recombinase family protein [Clostridium sporogenes]
MGRVYGYARVSGKDQNLDRQIEELRKFNKDIVLFTDKQSGKDFERKEYEIMKRVTGEGDTIVVKELDRLGRNKDLIKQELEYYKNKGVRVIILDIPTTTTNLDGMDEGIAKEMLKMINNILIEVLATMAEQERNKIKSRQKEGIAIAKEKGVEFGRPRIEIDDNFVVVYDKWKAGEIKAIEAMEILNLTKATFYRRVKEYENR